MNILEKIIEKYPERTFKTLDGYDNAIIDIDISSYALVYSYERIIENLMDDGMEEEDAIEFFSYNISYIFEGNEVICIYED